MILEIINPSDPYTMEADDLAVAAAAILFIGNGKLGLQDDKEETVLPLVAFSGVDVGEWFKAEFGRDLGHVFEHDKLAIADALDTVLIGNKRDRELYIETRRRLSAEDVLSYRDTWHDKKRSSMTDIGQAAWDTAKRIRDVVEADEAEADSAS